MAFLETIDCAVSIFYCTFIFHRSIIKRKSNWYGTPLNLTLILILNKKVIGTFAGGYTTLPSIH
jgi:hypothetical protein